MNTFTLIRIHTHDTLLYWHDQRFTGCYALRTLVHSPMIHVTKIILVHVHRAGSVFLREIQSKKRMDRWQEAEKKKLDLIVDKFG